MFQLSALIFTDFTYLEVRENGLFLPLSFFEPEMVFSSKLVHTFLQAIQFLWKKLSSENPRLFVLPGDPHLLDFSYFAFDALAQKRF